MTKPLMMCGHAANAVDKNGKSCCVMCIGIHEGADVVNDNPPSLEGRMATCSYATVGKYGAQPGAHPVDGHGHKPSSTDLPFFEHRPAEEVDRYYCGCWGWD